MIGMGDHHELVFAPGYDVDRVVRNGTLYQRHVGAGFEEEPEYRAGVGAGGADADGRVAYVEAPEHGWKHIRGDRGTGGDAERSALEASELAELAFGHPLDAKQLSGAGVQGSAGLGEFDAPGAAFQKGGVDLSL
jgi:hypothetical protein